MPSTKTFKCTFNLSQLNSYGNSLLRSDLNDMEDGKIKWYLCLFFAKQDYNSRRLHLTLNFPFFEYHSNWAKIKCAGEIALNSKARCVNLSFASEKTAAIGESIILYNSEIAMYNCYSSYDSYDMIIEGSITVEEANNYLNKLLEEQLYGDIVLVAEGRELLAFKDILAARSPVFAAMFENDMKEKRDNRVKIDDIHYEVLKEMVRYIYTEQVPKLKEISMSLFLAADKYQLSTLKKICEYAACSTLTVSNVCMRLIYSTLHNGTKLKSAAIQFIRQNKQEVIKSKQWKNMLRDHPGLLLNSVFEDVF